MRRLGDSCPDKKILAEKYKLQINSLFGSFLRNKEKERQLKFVQGSHKLRLKANDPNFVRCEPLSNDYFEVEMVKKRLVLDNPVYLGHTILNKAKELLLDFYCSFLDRYFKREDFMMLCTDTDSAFVALSSDNFEELVKPELRDEFHAKIYGKCSQERIKPEDGYFLTRKCCEKHKKFDAREPGLWKTEATGTEMLCLSSKTYLLSEHEQTIKMSCKGANKSAVHNPMQTYKSVLFDKKTERVENRGIRSLDGKIVTYRQLRNSFHYFYVKREILADGVSTIPLSITLSPWQHSYYVIEVRNPLSLWHENYRKPLKLDGILVLKREQWSHVEALLRSLKSKQIIVAGWDSFWSCGLNPRLAEVSNLNEMSGENNLGKLIESFVKECFN